MCEPEDFMFGVMFGVTESNSSLAAVNRQVATKLLSTQLEADQPGGRSAL